MYGNLVFIKRKNKTITPMKPFFSVKILSLPATYGGVALQVQPNIL